VGAKARRRGSVDRSIGQQRERDPAEFPGGDEAIEKLRSGIDQASRAMRDLSAGRRRLGVRVQERVRDMAKELSSQGERAVGTVSRQVEHNPLTSLAVAFAVGVICAALIRR